MAHEPSPAGEPDDSFFPTDESLQDLIRRAGLHIAARRSAADIWSPPAQWQERVEGFDSELRARYGDQDAWQLAERQSERIAKLLERSAIVPQVLSLRHDTAG
jgi:hypothetical protein